MFGGFGVGLRIFGVVVDYLWVGVIWFNLGLIWV